MVVLLTYGTARVLLAGDAEAKEEEYVAASYRTYTPGAAVRPIMIAGDMLVCWKPANLTSIFYPTFYPNRPQQRSTQADNLQEAIAEISRPNGALSNTERPTGTLR